MELTDIAPLKKWIQFEKDLFDRFHMNAAVYNAAGVGLTGKPRWCNRLCPQIKGNKDSLSAICAPGNQYFLAQAERTKQPVIGECDAGLMKVAVPVFGNGKFLGTAGGCGRLPDGGEVETFIVEQTLGLGINEIVDLCEGIETMTQQQAEDMAAYIEQAIVRFADKAANQSP
jgi:ligand-binding sensor protein